MSRIFTKFTRFIWNYRYFRRIGFRHKASWHLANMKSNAILEEV